MRIRSNMRKTIAAGRPINRQLIQALVMTVVVMVFGNSFTTNSLAQDAEQWGTDAKAATTQAAAEKKDMLLLFTGSDWCPPCIKLEKQVLGTSDFIEQGQQQFILVKFDFPQNTELAPELESQNAEWADRFGVEGFPTLVLVDSAQKPYAFTGFRDENPKDYLAHLSELQQVRETRDEFLGKAAAVAGLERAALLDQALSALDKNIVDVYYQDLVEEIGALDKDDASGLRTKYFAQRDREIRQAVMSNIAMVARLREPSVAVEFIDETLANHKLPADLWVVAMATKLRLLRTLNEVEQANELIDEMILVEGMDPDSRQRLIVNKAFYLVSLGQVQAALAELRSQISSQTENLLLRVAQGELLDSQGEYEQALEIYDEAMTAAAGKPAVLIEVVGAKADALVELSRVDEALKTLDSLVNDETVPGKLRAEVLLHKSLLLRESGRRRAALLAENKAIELVETPVEKSEIQKLVDQFRRKFDKPGGN